MIPAGVKGHLDVFATPDMSRAVCTSTRVTWGGGDCLDDSGELVRSCPRHAPAMYAQLDARHRRIALEVVTTTPKRVSRWWLSQLLNWKPPTREDYTLV